MSSSIQLHDKILYLYNTFMMQTRHGLKKIVNHMELDETKKSVDNYTKFIIHYIILYFMFYIIIEHTLHIRYAALFWASIWINDDINSGIAVNKSRQTTNFWRLFLTILCGLILFCISGRAYYFRSNYSWIFATYYGLTVIIYGDICAIQRRFNYENKYLTFCTFCILTLANLYFLYGCICKKSGTLWIVLSLVSSALFMLVYGYISSHRKKAHIVL